MKQIKIPFLPSAATSIILITYLALSAGLAYLMLTLPLLGLLGAIVVNLVVFLFLYFRFALPLYIVVAGPSVALSLAGSGILSRLYIGNMLFGLMVLIWILQVILTRRKSGEKLLPAIALAPLIALCCVTLISIIYSRLYPDPKVPYTFPHSNVSITIVNLTEMGVIIGLPLLLMIIYTTVHTVRDFRWAFRAYIVIGVLYALGTIFAPALGWYSQKAILGIRRPEVFGSTSSGLGTTLVLFVTLAFSKFLYTKVKPRVYWLALVVLFSMGVILAFGREAWIELYLTILLMLAIRTKNWSVLLFLLVPLLLLLIPGVSDFFDPSKVYGSDRTKIWQDAITIWQKSPYFGIGGGNFQFFDRIYGVDKAGLAHNQYLETLAEMGVQGLLCIIWILGVFGVIAVKSYRAAKTTLSKSISLSFLGFYICFIFGGFFTGILLPSAAAGGGTSALIEASYRWILFGLVLTIPHWEKEAMQSEQQLSLPEQNVSSPAKQEVVL
jgi:hypothetical protein